MKPNARRGRGTGRAHLHGRWRVRRVAAEYVVGQRQAVVTFGLGELSELAHDPAIAADVAEGQGNSEMHGRFLALAGCWFPANL